MLRRNNYSPSQPAGISELLLFPPTLNCVRQSDVRAKLRHWQHECFALFLCNVRHAFLLLFGGGRSVSSHNYLLCTNIFSVHFCLKPVAFFVFFAFERGFSRRVPLLGNSFQMQVCCFLTSGCFLPFLFSSEGAEGWGSDRSTCTFHALIIMSLTSLLPSQPLFCPPSLPARPLTTGSFHEWALMSNRVKRAVQLSLPNLLIPPLPLLLVHLLSSTFFFSFVQKLQSKVQEVCCHGDGA